jgi:hypothetical protein
MYGHMNLKNTFNVFTSTTDFGIHEIEFVVVGIGVGRDIYCSSKENIVKTVLKTYTRPAALKSRITKGSLIVREPNTNIVNFSR